MSISNLVNSFKRIAIRAISKDIPVNYKDNVYTIPTGLKAPITVTRESGNTNIVFQQNGNNVNVSLTTSLTLGQTQTAVFKAQQSDGSFVGGPISLTGVPATVLQLNDLTLSNLSINEGSISDRSIGTIVGKTSGSTLVLVDDAGGRVVLSGIDILTGLVPIDYEEASSLSITIRETKLNAVNSPKDTVITLSVNNVFENPSLGDITLSSNTVPENSPPGTIIGSFVGKTTGSSLSLLDDLGGSLAISDNNLVTTSIPLDFEFGSTRSITVRETLSDCFNSPKDSILSVTITNVFEQPNLGNLSLSSTSIQRGTSVTIDIVGATTGSTITGTVPSGLTLNSAVRTITGTPSTEGTFNLVLTETLEDSQNSPRTNNVALTVAAPAIPFTIINNDGYTVQYASTPTSLNPLDVFSVDHDGFDDNGNVAVISESLTATQRVRLPFPDQAILSNNTVALSGEILQTSVIPGVTNNSTLVSPKPIVNWVMTSRTLVGDTVRVGVTGTHWAGRKKRPFRCVVFTATDGTNTVTSTVTNMSISTTGAGDVHAVLAYETDLNLSSLANPANITINAKVYPWIGVASSVADSATVSGNREFSPRVFRRDTVKFNNPNVVYVSSTGNDTTGVVSTDETAAAASPCLTPLGAVNRARAVLGTAAGSLDALEIRLTEGTWSFSANPTANTTNFCVTITRAPGSSKANTIFQFGSVNATPNVSYLRYKGLTIQRTGAFYPYNSSAGFCIFEDCNWTTISSTGALASTAGTLFFWNGNVFTQAISNMISAANPSHAMIRGVDVTSTINGFHGFLVLGSRFSSGGSAAYGSYSRDNSIIQFCSFLSAPSSNAVLSLDTDATISNVSFSQILIVVTHTTTSTPSLRPSSDSVISSLTHVIFDNVLVASGHFQAGRINAFYDETPSVYRNHTFCRIRNSIFGGLYLKEGVFLATNGNGTPNPSDAPAHIGNWDQMYAVGWKNNHMLLGEAGTNALGQNEGLAYAGLGSVWASSNTTPTMSLAFGVNFTDWRATTANPTTGAAIAGTTGGNYTSPAGSALLGRVSEDDEVFPYDLSGSPRTRGGIGAYG